MVLKMEISYHLCKDGTWFWRWRSHTTFARMVRGFEDRDLIPPLQGWYVVLKMENSYHLCKDGTWCWRWRSHTTNAIRYFCCDNCSFVLFCFVLFCFVLFCFVLLYLWYLARFHSCGIPSNHCKFHTDRPLILYLFLRASHQSSITVVC